jgi:WD40 repeat protein
MEIKGREATDVAGLVYSPNGKFLVSLVYNGFYAVQVWDATTGKKLRELHRTEGDQDRVIALAVSPDGKTLATGGDDKIVRLWEVASGQERRRFVGHRNFVSTLAFSADGRLLASGSWDTTVLVWDLTGRLGKGP